MLKLIIEKIDIFSIIVYILTVATVSEFRKNALGGLIADFGKGYFQKFYQNRSGEYIRYIYAENHKLKSCGNCG